MISVVGFGGKRRGGIQWGGKQARVEREVGECCSISAVSCKTGLVAREGRLPNAQFCSCDHRSTAAVVTSKQSCEDLGRFIVIWITK